MGLRLQLEGDSSQPGGARTRGFSLSEYDLASFYAQPWVASASDAGIAMPGDGFTHPRFYGNFPRKIRFALDQDVISVEDAIRSMTSLPAQILGLKDRGLIREGQWADIVVMVHPDYQYTPRLITSMASLISTGLALTLGAPRV